METNIVEVENFVQQSEERRGSAFTQEVKRYLERYPNTQYVDVLLTDLNGCFRGKRIPVSSLKKLEKGCYFPASVFAMDILGNVVEEAGLGQEMGEPQSQVYSVDNLNHFADVLNDIDELAQLQLIPADGAVAEASPGQFEINLYHTDNVLEACDDALALKRLVRLMAEKHKMHATFMAKPYEEHAGSGMHIHISMQNNRGENVLSDAEGEDSPLLKKMLAGMIDLMPSSMALLAPNVNSYRRFQPGMYVPTQASWGHNNRTVALRIPCGDRHNHRVEYRVAGADANPYLVMAAIFAGILHGLDNELPLQEEVEGNGLEQDGLPFPIRQSDALGEFIENDHLRRYLGERFCHVYHACKNDELLQFERLITETEIEWMLKNA
ncbi:glutamine synthetase [Escherichia coli]|nr:glutamine synthetase [Escherichia coli]